MCIWGTSARLTLFRWRRQDRFSAVIVLDSTLIVITKITFPLYFSFRHYLFCCFLPLRASCLAVVYFLSRAPDLQSTRAGFTSRCTLGHLFIELAQRHIISSNTTDHCSSKVLHQPPVSRFRQRATESKLGLVGMAGSLGSRRAFA